MHADHTIPIDKRHQRARPLVVVNANDHSIALGTTAFRLDKNDVAAGLEYPAKRRISARHTDCLGLCRCL